jgi:hypothetical protein
MGGASVAANFHACTPPGTLPADVSYEPADLSKIRTRKLSERSHLVKREQFRAPVPLDGSALDLLDSLPDILQAKALNAVAGEVARAAAGGHTVVAACGGHVVKTGCAPLLIDLMQRGCIHAVALNGGAAIHDVELALIGETSEDVATSLPDGSFGTAEETGELFAEAASQGSLGESLGRILEERAAPYREDSLLATAVRLGLPVTVHVQPGADTVHIHPKADGAAIGAATYHDFRVLTSVVAGLESGVWLNIGSAVVLPEIFLKALTAARNLGHTVDDFAAANFDMLRHYRTRVNVVGRPPKRGYDLTGAHELLLPLFRLAVLQAQSRGGSQGSEGGQHNG